MRAFKFSMPAQEMCSGGVQDGAQPNPNLMEEDKPVLHGVNIRAATPDRLVQLCVESFGMYYCANITMHIPYIYIYFLVLIKFLI